MYYQRPLVYRLIDSFFRHWRLFAVAFLTIIVLLTAFVVTRPKTFATTDTVVMNDQTIPNPLDSQAEVVDWNAVQETVNHFQTLVETRDFLQAALQNPDGTPLKLNHPIDFNNLDALGALQKNIYIASTTNDAFTVGLIYSDPDDSVKILNALITLFINRNAQEKATFFTEQVAFIGNQVEQYKQKLVTAQSQLAQFKGENVGHLPSQQEAIEQQLTNLTQQVSQYQLTLKMDGDREKILANEVAATPKTIIASQTTGDSPLDTEIKNLQMQLTTDTTIKGMNKNHPEVQALSRQIADLQHQRDSKTHAGSSEASGILSTNIQPNPQWALLNNQLMQLRIDEEGLKTQVTETQAQVLQTQAGVTKVPEEERMMADLERDYAFNSDTYNTLNTRFAEAKVNEQLYLRRQSAMYERYMTSPPQASTSRSKTAMLFAGGIFLAFLVGLGLVVMSEALDRSFRDPYDLQKTLGVPVLAMLPDSSDLHVADSRTPLLTGGGRKRLGAGATPLLAGPAVQMRPEAAVAANGATSFGNGAGSSDRKSADDYSLPKSDQESSGIGGAGGAA